MIKSLPPVLNPMREALDGWEQMQADLMIAQDQVRELTACNNQLLSEVDFLRSELNRTTLSSTEANMEAVELRTELKSVAGVILTALKRGDLARKRVVSEYAVKPPVFEPIEEPSEPAAEKLIEVPEIISRLPPNAFQ